MQLYTISFMSDRKQTLQYDYVGWAGAEIYTQCEPKCLTAPMELRIFRYLYCNWCGSLPLSTLFPLSISFSLSLFTFCGLELPNLLRVRYRIWYQNILNRPERSSKITHEVLSARNRTTMLPHTCQTIQHTPNVCYRAQRQSAPNQWNITYARVVS